LSLWMPASLLRRAWQKRRFPLSSNLTCQIIPG
jgi:hypothetical protein